MMDKNLDFLVYQTADEHVSGNALIKGETIWLPQRAMAELFDVDKSTVSRRLKNIFAEGKLGEHVVVAKLQQPLDTALLEERLRAA